MRRASWALFYAVVGVLCFLAIRNALGAGGFAAILPALQHMPALSLLSSAGAVIGVYSVIWVIEQVALRDADAPAAAQGRVAAPLIANAVSAGAGFGILSGGALRARLYAHSGMVTPTAFIVASSVTLISVLGGALLGAFGLVLAEVHFAGFRAPSASLALRVVGAAWIIGLIGLALIGGANGKTIRIAASEIRLPSRTGLLWRIGLGSVDWIISSLALYVLLPVDGRPPVFDFAATFATFQLIGLATGAPAGLGVFEAMMLSFGNSHASPEQMAAALVCYRVTSLLAPVGLGLCGLAYLETRRPKPSAQEEPSVSARD